jgi:gamma-glutamylcyclotransferase (GGCT)/AIG2-like uncharacterized protein YtfP
MEAKENGKRLYLAYGSNLNLEQMRYRCPTARIAGKTELRGFELLFRGGVANIEPRAGSNVPALVWEIQPGDEAALDAYEGYPTLYAKQDIAVELNGAAVTAMAYVMTHKLKARLPSGYYYETIRQGYESAGFDVSALENALDRADMLKEEPERTQSGGMKWGC